MRGTRPPPSPPPGARRPDTGAARTRALAARMGTLTPAFVAQDVLELAGEVDRLRLELEAMRAACVIGLPYARGEAADVLRDVIAHAKGRNR